jgi:hypothetical protein
MDIESPTYSLLDWSKQVLDLPQDTIPMVMSVSYGNDEAQQTSKIYMEQCNTQVPSPPSAVQCVCVCV